MYKMAKVIIFCIKCLEVPNNIEIKHKVNGKIILYFYYSYFIPILNLYSFFLLLKKYEEKIKKEKELDLYEEEQIDLYKKTGKLMT